MHRILGILLFVAVFIFSCSEEKIKNKPLIEKEDPEAVIAHGEVDTLGLSDTLKNKGKITMEEILEAFRYCKETAENNLQCKYFIAKAIHDYFGISDFRIKGNYVDFEYIHPIVRSSTRWRNLGAAGLQKTLNDAQEFANKGKPVLAIHTDSRLGHVVIVMPGKLEKAANWGGLNCPQVASFFMIQDMESFVDKSIAFAWESPEGIEVFVRE
ncbi:MAG TPA: hypothetical protein VD905_10465 [Flavobacteriales bacterium]|nr:hypothetical protein [Flavobacteriales bacterium]